VCHEIQHEWHKNGAKQRAAMPEQQADPASARIFEEVERRLYSDEYLAQLVARLPEVAGQIAVIMATADERIGRLKMAQIVSGNIKRKVTRHEVEKGLEKLKEALRRPSHKVAGLSSGSPSEK